MTDSPKSSFTNMKKTLATAASILVSCGAFSKTSEEYDFALAEKLIDHKTTDLKDIAVLQLDEMLKAYPAKSDLVLYLKALCFHAQNQNGRFDAAVKQFKATSGSTWNKLTLLRTKREMARGKQEAAFTLYDAYFKANPKPPKAKEELEEWKKAVELSANYLSNAGRTDAFNKRLALLDQVERTKSELREMLYKKQKQILKNLAAAPAGDDAVADFKDSNARVIAKNIKLGNSFTIEFLMNYKTKAAATLVEAIESKKKTAHLVINKSGGDKSVINVSYQGVKASVKTFSEVNKWMHVAVTYNGTDLKVYLDGKLEGKGSKRKGALKEPLDLYVGGSSKKAGFTGLIDDVRVWTKARTEYEISRDKYILTPDQEGVSFIVDFDGKKATVVEGKANVVTQGKLAWGSKNRRELQITETIASLKSNTFINDAIAAFSWLEIINAYCLAGDAKNAVKQIKANGSLFDGIEKAMLKIKTEKRYSPMAGATYYYAYAYRLGADKNLETKPDKASKAFKIALDKLKICLIDYANSPYSSDASVLVNYIKEKVQKLGWTEEQLAPYQEILAGSDTKFRSAMSLYDDKQYEAAIADFRKLFSITLADEKIQSAMYYFLRSVIDEDKLVFSEDGVCWELEAIGDYIMRNFPVSVEASNACQRIGSRYAAESKKQPEKKALLMRQAMGWYERFIRLNPTDENAPVLKFKTVYSYYTEFNELYQKLQKVTDEKEKATVQDQMERALLVLERKGLELINNYPEAPKSISCLKIFGGVYSSLKQHKRSADYFQRYVDSEKRSAKNNPEILKMQFYAAQKLYMSENPGSAVSAFEKVAPLAQELQESDAASKKLVQDSYAWMAYSLSSVATGIQRDIIAVNKEISENKKLINAFKASAKKNGKAVVALQEEKTELNKNFKEEIDALDVAGVGAVNLTRKADESEEEFKTRVKLAKEERAKKAKQQRAIALSSIEALKKRTTELGTTAKAALRKATNTELEDNKAKISKINIEYDKIRPYINLADKKVAEFNKDKATALARLNEVKEKLAKLNTELATNRELLGSPIEKERYDAQVKQVQLFDQISLVGKTLSLAEAKYEKEEYRATVEANRWLENKKNSLVASKKFDKELVLANREQKIIKSRIELYKAQVESVKLGKAKVKVDLADYNGKGSKADVTKATADYRKAVTTVNGIQNQIFDLKIGFLNEDIASDKAEQLKLSQEIQKATDSLVPVKAKLKAINLEAVKYYEQFFAKYPAANEETAKCLSRLGKVYIDLSNFTKAAVYLDRLKKEYPKDPSLNDRKLDLANAYVTIGQFTKAADVFNDILANINVYSNGRLSQILREQVNLVDTGVLTGAVKKSMMEITYKIGEQLVKKLSIEVKKPKTDVKPITLELALFRTGEAAFHAGQFENAIKYYQKVLKHRAKTPKFFDIKLHQGIAYRSQKNKDLEAATACFYEITKYGDAAGPVKVNQAMLQMAITDGATETAQGTIDACNTIELIVETYDADDLQMKDVNDDVLWYAMYYNALMGNSKRVETLKAIYKKDYPEGVYINKINKLPSKKYSKPQPKAPAATK